MRRKEPMKRMVFKPITRRLARFCWTRQMGQGVASAVLTRLSLGLAGMALAFFRTE